MKSMYRRLTAAGFSDWLFLDQRRVYFAASVAVILSSNGNLTYSVQHCFDDLHLYTEAFTLARTTTTATMTKTNHGLSVGDYMNFQGCAAPFDGGYSVASVVDQDNVTFTVANSGATSKTTGGRMTFGRVFAHSALAGQTASADGNYSFPPEACRLIITAFTAGYADLIVTQQGA